MPRHVVIVRILQAITGLLLIAGLVLVLDYYQVVSITDLKLRSAADSASQVAKVKRPKRVKNLPYQQLLDEGDQMAFRGDFDGALDSYEQASGLLPKEVAPYIKIGDMHLLKKNYESARTTFELANSLDANNLQTSLKLTRSLFGQRKVIEAKAKLEKLTSGEPQVLYYKGLVAAFLNEQENAKKLLNRVIELSGSESDLTKKSKRILEAYADFDVAREAPAEFLQVLLAKAFDDVQEYGLAIELAFNALKTEHNYRDAWIILGHSFLNENKWFDAEDALTKALDLDASTASAFFFRGLARLGIQKIPEAQSDFETALRLGWKPQILVKEQLAKIAYGKGDSARAYALYKDIVTSDPTDITRFAQPMSLALSLGKKTELIELARKGFEAHPDSAFAENLLGWAFLENDDLIGAREHIERALARDGELAEARLNMGRLEERSGNPSLALPQFEKALSLAKKAGTKEIEAAAHKAINELSQKVAPLASPSTPSSSTPKPSAPAIPTPVRSLPTFSLE